MEQRTVAFSYIVCFLQPYRACPLKRSECTTGNCVTVVSVFMAENFSFPLLLNFSVETFRTSRLMIISPVRALSPSTPSLDNEHTLEMFRTMFTCSCCFVQFRIVHVGGRRREKEFESPFTVLTLGQTLQKMNKHLCLLFMFVRFKEIFNEKNVLSSRIFPPTNLKMTINGLALEKSSKLFWFLSFLWLYLHTHSPFALSNETSEPPPLLIMKTMLFLPFFLFCHSLMWFNSSKKEEDRKRAIFLMLLFHSTPYRQVKLFPFLLLSIARCKIINERWMTAGGESERKMEGKRYFLLCFSLFFQLHVVLLVAPLTSPHLSCAKEQKIQLCQRKKAAMVSVPLFFLLGTFSPFEEDSLFRVVDDDQLFISVAAKRRWSFASSHLCLYSID